MHDFFWRYKQPLIAVMLVMAAVITGAQGADGDTVPAEVFISEVAITTDATATPPVVVEIRGDLPDSCSSVSDTTQRVEENTIIIVVEASRPAEAMCAQVLQPFDIDVPLDTADLSPGEYTVQVNGMERMLTLTEALIPAASSVPTEADCLAATDTRALFLNPEGGYCFLYPDEYNAEILEDGSVFVALPDASETMGASLMITAELANERTLADIEARIQQDATDVRIEFEQILLGEQPAIVTDDIPARVPRRTAYAIANGQLYTLTLQPLDGTFPDALAAAEALWDVVTETFIFVDVTETRDDDLSAQQVNCPSETETSLVYTGSLYCFRYPANLDVVDVDSGQVIIRDYTTDDTTTDAGIVIQTAPATLLSLGDLEESIRATYPDADLTIERVQLGNVEALATDDIPGEVSSRRLYVLWRGQLITLTLQYTDEAIETDVPPRLWQVVTDTIVFLPSGAAGAQTHYIQEYEMTLQLPPDWQLLPASPGTYLVVRRDAPKDSLLEISDVDAYSSPANYSLFDRLAIVASTVYQQYQTDTFAPQFEWFSANDRVIGVRFTNLPGFCRVTFFPHEDDLIRIGSDPRVCEQDTPGTVSLDQLDAVLSTVTFD